MIYLVVTDRSFGGSAHAVGPFDENDLPDGFWQDIGETDGGAYHTAEEAERAAAELVDYWDAA